MMDRILRMFGLIVICLVLAGLLPGPAAAQSDQPIYLSYEGYFINEDGTYTLMFGYFNHNSDTVTIASGPNNRFLPSASGDRGQSTVFLPGRRRYTCRMVFDGDFDGNLRWTVAWAGYRDTTTALIFDRHYMMEVAGRGARAREGLDTKSAPRGVCINAAPRVSIAGGWATRTVNLDRSEELLLATRVTDDGLPRGGTVMAAWKQVDGPGTVTIRNPTPARTFASFSAPGVYNLELSVTDSDRTIVRRLKVEAISRDALAPVTSARLSPDGGRLAFRAATQIWHQPLDAGPAERLFEGSDLEWDPAFSPDGRYLAVARTGRAGGELCVFDFESGERATVCSGGLSRDLSEPVFSPDSRHVAFVDDEETVRVVDLDSGRMRTVAVGSSDLDQWLNWSHDGQRLVFVDHSGRDGYPHRVMAVDLIDGTTTIVADRLPEGPGLVEADGPLQANGQLLYFVGRDVDATPTLFSLSFDDGTLREPITQITDFDCARVSADGKWLAVCRDTGIWVARLGTEPVNDEDFFRQISSETGDFAFTPDGAALIYVVGNRIWRQPLEGGEREEIPIRLER